MRARALILDFDGVICDSMEETFVSSWIAYFDLYRRRKPSYMPVSLRRDFAKMRPLIRSGEDFMLIQEILEQGMVVSRQSEFDSLIRASGAAKMRLFQDLFYQARSELLAKDRASWLALNRIYPHIATAFRLFRKDALVYILSTKKAEFIAEILRAKEISMPRDRLLYSGEERKTDIIGRLAAEHGFAEAIFIDDQIDHLTRAAEQVEGQEASGPRVLPYLATWGYVQEDWLREPLRVPTITPQEFLSLVQREFS